MERVEGIVPPDIMPYPFGSWLSEAPRSSSGGSRTARCGSWPQLHGSAVDPDDLAFLELERPGDTALRRHLAEQCAYYEWVVADGGRSPLIERTFAWLEEHWPADEGETVISWGDSRIGNMMFRDFEPVAVLDWEMAAVGPREIDLGLDGLPPPLPRRHRPQMRACRACRTSCASTTWPPPTSGSLGPRTDGTSTSTRSYAALRHAIVMSRVARRQVLFGEIEMPDDPDDMIMHRATLEQMLENRYLGQL